MKFNYLIPVNYKTILAIFVVTLVIGGCSIKPINNKVQNKNNIVITNISDEKFLFCNTNNDCVKSQYQLNTCCPGCSNIPMNRESLEQQKTWRLDNCSRDEYCILKACMPLEVDVICKQNKCITKSPTMNYEI